ncbi:22197_t:CDS:2, partial [Racocetra persica]
AKRKETKEKKFTGAQKAEICRLRQKGVSQVKLAEKFKVAEATISATKNWKVSLLEEALALWVSRANIALQTVTDVIIQHKATQLAKRLEVTGFTASDGWLSNFKKRHYIKEYNVWVKLQ